MTKKKIVSYEKSIDTLESLIQKMDAGELSLEESLAAFEQGIGLIRDCQSSLKNAELKVQQLLEDNGQLKLDDVDSDA